MKKYILIILIILIIIVALGLVYYFLRPGSENGTSNGNDKKEPDYLVYVDDKWSFEINYSTDWEEETLQGQEPVAFEISAPKEESGTSRASLLIIAYNISSGQVFEDKMQESIERLEVGGILISSSKETISDTNAYKLVYGFKDDFSSGLVIKAQHYFIDGGEVWYEIIYNAEQGEFDKYLLEAEQMIETFRIIK